MLRELKFVQGAVAKKDFVPAMTHFSIQNGFVRAYNGTIALCSPIQLDINCTPKALALVRAIEQCEEVITVNLTPAGKLKIQSGGFKAFVENAESYPIDVEPSGEDVQIDGEAFLAACRTMEPFIGNDASRRWANGLLLKGSSAFATNNTILCEYWIGTPFPYIVCIPNEAVDEILRVNEPPIRVQMDRTNMTFHYTDGRWIRTQLLDAQGWPHEKVSEILSSPHNMKPIDERIFAGIEKLKKMADGSSRLYIRDGMLRTHVDNPEEGASFDLTGVEWKGCYQIHMLGLLKGKVTHADFTTYPAPCLFAGGMMRGAIIGMRMANEGQAFSATGKTTTY